jgi:hypothetical protein
MNISSCFAQFIAHIRPSREQMEDAERQVAFLKEHLIERVAEDGQFHLERIFLAGSSAKHTNLARSGKGTFDIDLGVYYRSEGQTEEQLKKLLPYTCKLLRKAYPEKPKEDFHLGKNAVNVFFRTTGLQVDVVPIIRDGSLKRKNSGWIPRQDKLRLTSITAHIHFIHKRTACSKQIPGPVTFNDLVRLMKWWNRKLPDDLQQCSYFCELITAAALRKSNVTGDWQSTLCNVFAFLSKHAFQQPIIFSDYYVAETARRPNHQVIVLDAVNANNNLTRKWNGDTRRRYVERIQ